MGKGGSGAGETKSKKGGNKSRTSNKGTDEEARALEEARIRVMQERAKQETEDAKAAMFKPVLLDAEARTSWKDYMEDFTQFFSELLLKQSAKSATGDGAEGTDAEQKLNEAEAVATQSKSPRDGSAVAGETGDEGTGEQ